MIFFKIAIWITVSFFFLICGCGFRLSYKESNDDKQMKYFVVSFVFLIAGFVGLGVSALLP